MRVLVCGGRAYTDRAELYAELDRLNAEYAFTTIIAGGAGGGDALALEWAQARGIARKRSERNGDRLAAQEERVRLAMRAYWRKAGRISWLPFPAVATRRIW
jgi:hypothetical protein